MLNLQEFEENVYVFVTREVNRVVSPLVKDDSLSGSDYISLQASVIRTLNSVSEEVAAQILSGALMGVCS